MGYHCVRPSILFYIHGPAVLHFFESLEYHKVVYRMYKVNLTFENYLTKLPDYLRFSYSRFRCRNNNFPVERGARENIPRILRICTYCNDESIGDEFRYLLQCKHFLKDRLLYMKCRSFINPSTFTFKQIINPTNSFLPLCKFNNVITRNVL